MYCGRDCDSEGAEVTKRRKKTSLWSLLTGRKTTRTKTKKSPSRSWSVKEYDDYSRATSERDWFQDRADARGMSLSDAVRDYYGGHTNEDYHNAMKRISRVRRNPRGNYTTAEKKSIKRHTRKAIKRSGVAVRRMVSQAKRLTRVARNPKPPRSYIIEALVRDGMKLHYRFWTGKGNGQRALLTERNRAKKFTSQTMAREQAKKLLPFCGSKIHSLRVVPA